jgi:hypothetical protein
MRRGGAGPTKAFLGRARGRLSVLPGDLALEQTSFLGCSGGGGAWGEEGGPWAGFRLLARREPNPFEAAEGAGGGGVSESP